MDELLLYGPLAGWFPLLTAPPEYAEEAAVITAALEQVARRPLSEMLELGSGGGNMASHLKARFRMTLSDRSPQMLDVSRALNPECEHLEADMRTLRLNRTFDAVLIHDAIMYLTTQNDLAAAIRTAAAHLAPGGAALFVPDDVAETYRPRTQSGGHDGEGRSMRYLEWAHAPAGTTYTVTYVYALREGDGPVRIHHENHTIGLFPRATWLRLIEEAGLEASVRNESHWATEGDRDLFAGVRG